MIVSYQVTPTLSPTSNPYPLPAYPYPYPYLYPYPYQSDNTAELEETRELLSQWGCHPWDGRQVRAGKDWISQWLAMANSGDTALFVFLISRVCCATSPVVVPPGQTLGLIATPARRILTLYWRDCGGAQAEFPAFRSMPRRVQPRDV